MDEPMGKGQATRRLILDTATTMFGEQGYRGTSLRDIAARCDMTHPGLKYHFPTKEDLLMAVLSRRDELDAVDRPVHGQAAGDTLRTLIETARVNETKRGLVELFATLSGEATAADHPAHAYFADRYQSLLASVTSAYATLEAEGHLRPGVTAASAASLTVAAMDGLQVQWLLDDGATPMPHALATLIDSLLVTPLARL